MNPREEQRFLVCVCVRFVFITSPGCQSLFWVFPPLTPEPDTSLQLIMSFHSSHWSIAGTAGLFPMLVFSIFNLPRQIRLFPRSLNIQGENGKISGRLFVEQGCKQTRWEPNCVFRDRFDLHQGQKGYVFLLSLSLPHSHRLVHQLLSWGSPLMEYWLMSTRPALPV